MIVTFQVILSDAFLREDNLRKVDCFRVLSYKPEKHQDNLLFINVPLRNFVSKPQIRLQHPKINVRKMEKINYLLQNFPPQNTI